MEPHPHIAVVDDHQDIRELVARYLGQQGYLVTAAGSGAEFRQQMEVKSFQLVVLDIMMPGEDGLSLCGHIRSVAPHLPMIFLTAVAGDADRIVGLELGADDYLEKPFNPRELLARIRAVLRRSQVSVSGVPATEQAKRLLFGNKVLDKVRHEVVGIDGVAVPLSSAEFRLLTVFLNHPGKVLSRDELSDFTRGRETEAWDRSIDNQVSRLRRKIEEDPRNPVLIKTHWGDGYCFTEKVVRE
jgi:two-component system OmpR family response regulator